VLNKYNVGDVRKEININRLISIFLEQKWNDVNSFIRKLKANNMCNIRHIFLLLSF